MLTVAEASAVLRVSRWSLYRLIRSGKLQTIKIGRRRLVPAAALSALVERLRGEEYF
jgi:excisionase family DNA binding protein